MIPIYAEYNYYYYVGYNYLINIKPYLYLVPVPSLTPIPFGNVNSRLSSRAEFSASAHSGSTSPLKIIQIVEFPADVTALDNTPSFHSL